MGGVGDIPLSGDKGNFSMSDTVYERQPELFSKRPMFRACVGQAERQRIYYSQKRNRWHIGIDFDDDNVVAFSEQDAELPTLVTGPWAVRNANGVSFSRVPTFEVLAVTTPPPLAPFTVMMVNSGFQVPQAFPSSRTPVLRAEPNRTQEVEINAPNLLLPREVAGNPNIYHKITYDLAFISSPEADADGCEGIASVAVVDGRATIRILATQAVGRCDYQLSATEEETGEVWPYLECLIVPPVRLLQRPPQRACDVRDAMNIQYRDIDSKIKYKLQRRSMFNRTALTLIDV